MQKRDILEYILENCNVTGCNKDERDSTRNTTFSWEHRWTQLSRGRLEEIIKDGGRILAGES